MPKSIPEVKIGNEVYELKDRTAREHLVEVSTTQPSDENNRLWIKNQEAEYEVPTIDEFNGLKSALDRYPDTVVAVTGIKSVLFKPGYYKLAAEGSTVDPTTVYESSLTMCAKIDVSLADVVTIVGNGGAGISRLYAAVKEDNTVHYLSAQNITGPVTYTVNNGDVKYLLINILKSSAQMAVYIGKTIPEKLADLDNEKQNTLTFDSYPAENSSNPVTSDGVYDCVNDMADDLTEAYKGAFGIKPLIFETGSYYYCADNGETVAKRTSDQMACAKAPVSPGEKVTIYASGSNGRARLYVFTTANGKSLGVCASDLVGLRTVDAPENAAFICVNNKITVQSAGYWAYVGQIKFAENDEIIPPYYTDYISSRLADITTLQKTMSSNQDAFWLISDYHYRNNEGHSKALLKYLAKKTGITRLHFLGDAGGSEGTTETAKITALQNSANVWAELASCVPEMYGVLGNHEWINSEYYGLSAMFGAYLNRFKTKVEMDGSTGSYWIDNKANRIRYFFIQNTASAAPVGGNDFITWFDQQLSNVPENYSVAVFVHHGYIPASVTSEEYGFDVSYNYLTIRGISQFLRAWLKRGSVTFNNVEYSYASGTEHRSVIGVFCAHMHHSTFYYGGTESGTDDITVFRASEDALNENTIGINGHPWFWKLNATSGEYEQTERTPGTIYEQCFYCVQIDLTNKHLYITSIGGDRDWDAVYETYIPNT